MTDKELVNLEHYRILIEKRKFNEYDIIGFLILIREYINIKTNPIFHDFANGIAHRERNKGIIYDNIYNAIINGYTITKDNKVTGYNGIEYNRWIKECKFISCQFNIKITPIIMKELLLCMFSIFHRSKIITNKNSIDKKVKIKGSIELITSKDSISFITSDDINKLCICFMKMEGIEIINNIGFILDSVETYRKNKKLYLKSNNEDILAIKGRVKL